jgi:hypothetical protein
LRAAAFYTIQVTAMHEATAPEQAGGGRPAGGHDSPAAPAGEVLAGRWAFGLGCAFVLLLAAVEAAHGYAASRRPGFEQVVQLPAPISSPASHPDVSAPDPGDNP